MIIKRMAAVLALMFGIAGMAGCLAGAYGVRLVVSLLDRANNKVFDAVDRSLGVVQDRMSIVQQRVIESKVTTTEVSEAVLKWAAKKGQDRLLSQLRIETTVEKLSGHLRAADLRLEASREAVRDVRRLLELAQNLGATVNPASTDAVQELLVSLQDALQQAECTLDGVRGFATFVGENSVEDRQARVAKLLARILLTLSEVDRRLEVFAVRLSEVRAEARQWQATTNHSIVLGSVVCYGLLAWVLAGQAALSWWGWSCCRRARSPADPTEKEKL